MCFRALDHAYAVHLQGDKSDRHGDPRAGCDLLAIVHEATAHSTLPWPEHAVSPCEVSINFVPT